MSDARIRELEAAAQRGEPGAREALSAARCRSGLHAWSCTDTTGASVSYIWCVRCLERRPKDEHEIAVEGYLAYLHASSQRLNLQAVTGSGWERLEIERRSGEITALLGELLRYREAIAPYRLIALPAPEL